MRIRTGQILIFVFAFYFVFIFSGNAVYAHKMLIEHVEEGEIQVIFEGGEPASEAEVELLNEQGQELDSGTTGEDGYFSYDPELNPASIVATDHMGHRAELKPGEDNGTGGLSTPVTTAIVFAALAVIAGVFYVHSNKKQKESQNDG